MNTTTCKHSKTNERRSSSKQRVMSESEDKLSTTIRVFCSETTVHGLGRTVASRSRKEKCFWLLVLLCCTGYAFYQVATLIITYLEYPVDVKLDVNPKTELEFPAITLCNMNPFRKSQTNFSSVSIQINVKTDVIGF